MYVYGISSGKRFVTSTKYRADVNWCKWCMMEWIEQPQTTSPPYTKVLFHTSIAMKYCIVFYSIPRK